MMTKTPGSMISKNTIYAVMGDRILFAKAWEFKNIIPIRSRGVLCQKHPDWLFVVGRQDIPKHVQNSLPNGGVVVDFGPWANSGRSLLLVVDRDDPSETKTWSWFEIENDGFFTEANPIQVDIFGPSSEPWDYLEAIARSVEEIPRMKVEQVTSYQPLSASELSEHPDYGRF